MLSAERDEYSTINFEETELRLGLPGGCGGGFAAGGNEAEVSKSGGKRGFSETETAAVDLKLNLSSSVTAAAGPAKDGGGEKSNELKLKDKAVTEKTAADSGKPPAKRGPILKTKEIEMGSAIALEGCERESSSLVRAEREPPPLTKRWF